ncbi:MAG TPA: hypothetical protein VN903_11610 [Polyangia bacterium]|jgi:hypothetical protein|nr:hypothetical protein [Polyangia bacterium]
MAATATELRRIYSYLLGEHDHPDRLPALQDALGAVRRDDASTRTHADRLLTIANGGVNPELTHTQLECLRVVLSQKDFAPIVPTVAASEGTSTSLVDLYKRLFSEPDLGHLRALQRAVFEYDKLGTEPKRRAVLDLLRELSPKGNWSDAHVGALDALLVRDITFKHVSPFQVTGDYW